MVSSRTPKPRHALMPRFASAQPRASSRRSGCGPPRRHARGHQARPPRATSPQHARHRRRPHRIDARSPVSSMESMSASATHKTSFSAATTWRSRRVRSAALSKTSPAPVVHEFQEGARRNARKVNEMFIHRSCSGHPPMFEPRTTSCSTRAPAPVVPRPCVHVQESFPPLGPLRTVRWSRADLSPDSSCRLSPPADDAKPRKSTLWADARTYWLSRRSPQDHHQIHRCPDHGPASGLARSSSAATETLSDSADREATHRTACWTRCRGGGTM